MDLSEHRLVQPIGLASAFALVLVATCCRADNSFILYFDLLGVAEHLVAAFGAGALVCCVALIAAPLNSTRSRVAWTLTSTASCLCGVTVAWMASNSVPSDVCALIAGALLGFGAVGLLGQWGLVIGEMPQPSIPLTVAFSFLGSSVLWFVLQFVHGFVPNCVAMLVFALCAGLLLLTPTLRSATVPSRDAGYEVEEGSEATEIRPAVVRLVGFGYGRSEKLRVSRFAEAAGAFTLNGLVMGLTFWSDAAGLETGVAAVKPLAYLLACVVSVVVVRHGLRCMMVNIDSSWLMRSVFLCATALLLALVAFGSTDQGGALFFIKGIGFLVCALLNVFGFATAFCELLASGTRAVRACALLLVMYGCGQAVGMALYLGLGHNVSLLVLLAVAGVYFAVVALAGAVAAVRRSEQPPVEAVVDEAEERRG